MDARIKSAVVLAILLSLGADYSTEHFVVSAPDPHFAKQVALAAEQYRRDLAIEWLGAELPEWSEKCPITVRMASQAGGQTSFGFVQRGGRSEPIGWQMELYGSPERILDSVLPHEVTHTIFATHFGRPLPRWADEGACTTVEHEIERSKNHALLMQFLTSNRGIPFNRMFAMKQYPHDIYPLYAQGYSLTRFLIMQHGRRHFVNYVGAGMMAERPGMEPRAWDAVTKKYYGFNDLSELQVRWVQWVKQGCPDLRSSDNGTLAQDGAGRTGAMIAATTPENSPKGSAGVSAQADGPSWYAAISAGRSSESNNASSATAVAPTRATAEPYRPGSTRNGAAVEVLATVVPSSVSANRIDSGTNYSTRPEIEFSPQPATLWR